MEENRNKRGRMRIGLILLVVIVLILVFLGTQYNALVRSEAGVSNAWAQVQVNYQRRADLIPNLVQTVKGYAQHEKEVFESIAKLRSGYQEAQSPKQYDELDRQFHKSIQIAVESYPALKANENFSKLQDELAGTENRIAVARRDYNQAATHFNVKIRVFPRNLLAGLFGFEVRDLFQAQEGAHQAPSVDFSHP